MAGGHSTCPAAGSRVLACLVSGAGVACCPVRDRTDGASRLARHAGPARVGNGTDYSAQVPGLISPATGTLENVSPGTQHPYACLPPRPVAYLMTDSSHERESHRSSGATVSHIKRSRSLPSLPHGHGHAHADAVPRATRHAPGA